MAALERFGAYNDTITTLHPDALGLKCSTSDLVDIAGELQYNRTLTSIDLTNVPIDAEAAQALGKALAERNSNIIQHIKFSNCGLTGSVIAPLAEALQSQNTHIEIANFSDNPLRDEGAVAIGSMLEVNSTLRSLDVSACKIAPAGANALAAAISGRGAGSKLKTLVLANNKLREAGATALCKGLEGNRSIIVLDLSGNSINREGGVAISTLLRANTTIESINLAKNFLSDSVPYIASAMCERGKPARLLDLSSNRITSDICKTMAQVLEGHKFSIACFSMENNALGDDGLVALYHALKGTAVQFLDLSCTSLTHHSGVVISDLVSSCSVLNSLQIDGNALGDEALTEIALAFAKAPQLQSLNLERTNLGLQGCKTFADAIRKHRRARKLVFAENKNLGKNEALMLLDALASIKTLELLDLSDLALDEDENVLRALLGVFLSNGKLDQVDLEYSKMGALFPGGHMSRQQAMSLVDPKYLQQGSVNTSAATAAASQSATLSKLSAIGGDNASQQAPGSGSSSAQQSPSRSLVTTVGGGGGANPSQVLRATFRPNWATTIPMEHAPLASAGDDDDAEDGANIPLVPAPNSLHHPLYPGYGKGRFSNGSILQPLNDPVPYNVSVSRGPTRHFIPTADGTTLLTEPPRRPMKQSPYSIAALEGNMLQLPITDDQLRRKFNELDVDGNGYLDRDEFKRIYMTFQNFGIQTSEKDVDGVMKQYCMWEDGKVSYDEFCILMLRLATR